MKKHTWIGLAIIMIVILLSGCGKEEYAAVPINEAVDKCVVCNMQVKDDVFAVQLTTKEGKNYKFDDLGCMNEWTGKNGTDTIGARFVRDYNTKEWISYDKAAYVYDPSFKTPMAYGIYSFKDSKSAQAFIDKQQKGKLMSAADLKSHTWERAKGANMGGHGHDKNAHSESNGGNGSMKMGTDNKGMHGQ